MRTKSKKHVGVYIYKSKERRGDECYYIKYRAHGTQVNEKVGWKSEGYSQDQAASVRNERIHAARHGRELPQKNKRIPKFSEAYNLFINSRVSISEKRMYEIQCRYNKYLHSLFGNSKLVDITVSSIRSMIKRMESDGLHGATIKHYIGIVSMVYEYMKTEHNYKHPNPTDNMKYHAQDRRRERYLTKDEASKLLRGMLVAGNDLYLQTALMLFTGMRLNEVMNIKGRDINFDAGQIRVTGKGRNGVQKERHCEMNDLLKGLLKDCPLAPGDKLFKRSFRKVSWQNVVDSLGLNNGVKSNDRIWKVTPHTLRHTFGSWLGQNGVSPMVIQQVMGHSKIQTSMRYAKLGPRAGQLAVASLTEGLEL